MIERCERCGKMSLIISLINSSNASDGFSQKRIILCDKCRALWHIAFAILNNGSYYVQNLKATKKAWKKFMLNDKEKVEFT